MITRARTDRIPEHLRIHVRVTVDESGRDHVAVGIDGLFRFAVDAPDGGDASVGHRDVGAVPRGTRTVDHGAVLDDEVVAHFPLREPDRGSLPSPFRTRLATFQRTNPTMLRSLCFLVALFAAVHAHPAEESPADAAAARAEFAEAYKTFKRLNDEGKNEEALPYAERAYRLGLQIYGENHTNTAALALNLGEAYEKTGHRKEAVKTLDKAIELYQLVYGQDSRELIDPFMARANATGAWDAKTRDMFYRAGTRHRAQVREA